MYVWFRGRARERKERTQECVYVFGIRASTGEAPQMGDTLDIISRFTTHSSDCLFTSRYVRCVCVRLCDICSSVCPCLYVYLHILSCTTVHDHVNTVCVRVHVCFCWLPRTFVSCLSWTTGYYSFLSIGLSQSQNRRGSIAWSLSVSLHTLSFLTKKTRS